jgi:hypothetical protein
MRREKLVKGSKAGDYSIAMDCVRFEDKAYLCLCSPGHEREDGDNSTPVVAHSRIQESLWE